MSERIEACRRKAIECQRAALAAPDPNIRQMYLDLAKQWKELAEHAARLSGTDAVGLFRGRLVRSSPAARARNGAPFPGRFQDFDTTARISNSA